ncbi:serine/threonine-protein kinase [Heyndrickxia sp. FSL W8-0496]|uniref:serine/threonine protein kinase n=1 Tax=Heyndrickxia TaxID=2837504 RepID=UPI0030FAF317
MFITNSILNERYKLLQLLFRGGMGEVWVAKDIVLDRKVAIKTVSQILLNNDDSAIKVFQDEAKIGARLLGHPNIVAILDYGIYENDTQEKDYYIVMEYVEGMNVETFIKSFKSILDEETYYHICLLIAWEMGRAIDYAHKQGILHRDIKPLNSFISLFGVTKVGDFGLARIIDAVTRTHTVNDFQSPPYSAPEQWKGEKHVEGTDIYQFGCTLYHLFTGRLIFDKGKMALMYAHLNEEPQAPKDFCESMPVELSDKILGMVNKEIEDRTDLWEINDIIANELQKSFTLKVTVDKENTELIDKIVKITDFSSETLVEKGEAQFDFPDSNEVLSEGIQLILNGITSFSIIGKEQTVQV